MSEEKENLPLFDGEGEVIELPVAEETPAAPAAETPAAPAEKPQAPHCSEAFLAGGSFGTILHRMRVQCGKELQEISAETRIPLVYLQALEA